MDAQRSDAWFASRTGMITASRMHDVMALGEGGEFKSGPRKGQPRPVGAARISYIHEVAAERITGMSRKQISAPALQWGKDVEPHAVAAYEVSTGVIVTPAGFVRHPELPYVGASPDFLVNADGGGEVKCPESQEVHLSTLIEGLPPEHIEQIQSGLWCTERAWWDFVSFHPYFPDHMQLYVQRVWRDDEYIARLRDACVSFEADVQAILSRFVPQQVAA